jgi:hypothetical protein
LAGKLTWRVYTNNIVLSTPTTSRYNCRYIPFIPLYSPCIHLDSFGFPLSLLIMNLFKRKSSRGVPQKQPPSTTPTAAPTVPPPTTIANSTLDLRTSCSSLVLDNSNIAPLPSSPESQHRTLVKPVIGRKILNDQNANGSRRSTSVSFLPSFLRFLTNVPPSADRLALMPPKPTAICLRSLNQMLSHPHQKTLMTACISRIHLIPLLLALPEPPHSHQVQSTPLLDLARKQTQTNSSTKPIPLLVHLS